MFPTELELTTQRKQLEREAANHRLAQIARGDQPTLWERLRARLITPEPISQDCEAKAPPLRRRDVIATSR